MKKRSKLSVFIFVFLLISVFYPLLQMLIKVEWQDFGKLVTSLSFKEAFTNSLLVTSIATVFSVGVAYLLAFTLNRTNIKHRALLKVLLTLPMLIPSISHGLGLINLFGANGIISSLFGFDVIGSVGIIMGSVLYSFPVAFLMLDDGFNYIDNNMYDNAKVLGLNRWQTFKTVTLCYLKKPLLSAIFAVFTMIFTDYGVPLSVGGKFITLPVFLYKEVIGLLDFSKGTMIGLFLLIPALISFLFDNFTKDYANAESTGKKYRISYNKTRDVLLTSFVYLILTFVIIILGSFVYYAFINNYVLDRSFSFIHFKYVFNNDIGKYIFNSLLIAMIVSIVGTTISYFTAYVTARIKGKFSKIIHILTISSLAIPGIVLGLSYTIGYSNSFIYNTYLILVLVNIIHFIASPYLMAYNALQKVNPNYESIAKTCNISMFRIIKDVIIPCTKKTVREMFAYFFVNSMITISAVTFLFNTRTMPLSLLINNYEGNMMLGEAAIISLIILVFNLVVKGSVYLINRREYRRSEKYGLDI
ncbi:MAG: ABC transporter permease subunit [Bacilli bacterium]|nr:ABC transporter permease subunit [Bacilli bacterium]